jgi:hypothetical protein
MLAAQNGTEGASLEAGRPQNGASGAWSSPVSEASAIGSSEAHEGAVTLRLRRSVSSEAPQQNASLEAVETVLDWGGVSRV